MGYNTAYTAIGRAMSNSITSSQKPAQKSQVKKQSLKGRWVYKDIYGKYHNYDSKSERDNAIQLDTYFDWNGKVYRSYDDASLIPEGFIDNRDEMMARYGKYLGWRKDPNFKRKSVQHTTDVKNLSIGNTNILQEIATNPAEPTEYNRNNLANWQLFEGWKPEDYETLGNKVAATGAATAGVLGASMLAGPAMAYTTARLMPQVGRQAVMSGYRGPGSKMFSRMMGGNGNPVNGGNALQNWYWGGREGATNSSFMSRIGQMTEGAANSVKNYFTTPVAGGNSGVPQFYYIKKNGGQLISKNPIERFKANFRIVAQ